MNYIQKYHKYKGKYLKLKQKITKNMIGGNLDELILQIPLNFPKQRTEVPPYYKNTDGSLVVRFNVLLENCNWENILNDYNPTN